MNKNVTFIDDLFDVSSIQPSANYMDEGNNERDSYQSQIQSKHIRKYKDASFGINGGMQNDFFPLPPPTQIYQHQYQHQHQHQHQHQPQPQPQPQYQPQPQQIYPHQFSEDISCITIANHIKECPICSRFYNNDHSIYIISIILLIIVCILLVKKIIEKV
jgi:hypothetical protein